MIKEVLKVNWYRPICSILYWIAGMRATNPQASVIFYICSVLYCVSFCVGSYRTMKKVERGPRLGDEI